VSKSGGGRAGSLDGIRGIALACPIVVHLGLVGSDRGLWLSIGMFFTLSAFLVTSLALREIDATGRLSLSDFWMRRIRRLLPASLLVLALIVAVAVLVDWPGMAAVRGDVLSALVWGANWEQLHGGGYWDSFSPSLTHHFWSLSFEEQVYVVFPLFVGALVLVGRRISRRRSVPFAAVLAVGSSLLVVGSWALLWTGDDAVALYLGTFTRLGEIAFGMLAACISHLWSKRRLGPTGASVVILVAMVAAAPFWVFSAGDTVGGVRWGITMATPVTAFVIAMLWRHPESIPSRVFSWSIPAWLGRRAYGIYLLHLPIIEFMARGLDVEHLPAWAMVVAVAATIAGAGAMFRWFEEPLRVGQFVSSGRTMVVSMAVGMVVVAASAVFVVADQDEVYAVPVAASPPADLSLPPVAETPTVSSSDEGSGSGSPVTVPSTGPRKVALVVGDSTAWVTHGAVKGALDPEGWATFEVHMVGCPFGGDVRLKSSVMGGAVTVRELGEEPGCDAWWNQLLGEWQRAVRPSVIVVVGGYGLAYEIDPNADDEWCRLADGSGRCETWAATRLTALADRLRVESPDATVVWTTPGHVDPYGPLDIPGEAIDALDRLVRDTAAAEGDPVIDLGSWLDDHLDLTVDGTHIGPEGVKALTPWMVDELVPLLPTK
jgi:peptidoglycan/LPS O-acetylase OafA/YrhL